MTGGRHTFSEEELASSIRRSEGPRDAVQTTLRTDERVIARVTDGIYRQPASALRELISNAYDADANKVVISTDAPRFGRISVEDDGHGMSPEVVAHLLNHIGGSAKRSPGGGALGITSTENPLLSPGGRRLIGKIGIGLFSVSQLTHTFQIITKVEGDAFRTVADVVLRQYADEELTPGGDANREFEAGKVNVWRERAADVAAHGTTVILTSIRPQARDTLRSSDLWAVIEQAESQGTQAESSVRPPRFHIGRVDQTGNVLRASNRKFDALPWTSDDSPSAAFVKLVDGVWGEVSIGNPNPQLERLFDYYLRMVWQLSLSVPLPYVADHLFDKRHTGTPGVYLLSNELRGNATQVPAQEASTIRQILALSDPIDDGENFQVMFDDLQLFRPIKFDGLPTTAHALKHPLVFIGKHVENFESLPRSLSGGSLAFEAYLIWTPKVAPTEHQGALVRIHGSSGTLFDPTFMRYQVSEQTRLRQITCEIFVSEGLDSALNIDRESFNAAHPHAVYIMRWLHGALRQLATTQKRIAGEVRTQVRAEGARAAVSEIMTIAMRAWQREARDEASLPPAIRFDSQSAASDLVDTYLFPRSVLEVNPEIALNPVSPNRAAIAEEKLRAIVQILAAHGLLEELPSAAQEALIRDIFAILILPDDR